MVKSPALLPSALTGNLGPLNDAKLSFDNFLWDMWGGLFSCSLQNRRPMIGIFLQPVITDAPVVSNLSIPAVSAPHRRLVLFKLPSAIRVLLGCEQPGFEHECWLYHRVKFLKTFEFGAQRGEGYRGESALLCSQFQTQF